MNYKSLIAFAVFVVILGSWYAAVYWLANRGD